MKTFERNFSSFKKNYFYSKIFTFNLKCNFYYMNYLYNDQKLIANNYLLFQIIYRIMHKTAF